MVNNEATLTLEAAAARLSVSRTTVRRMIADGTLPAVKFGPRSLRVKAVDLERFISTHSLPLADHSEFRIHPIEAQCVCGHAFSQHSRRAMFDAGGFTGAGFGLALQAAMERESERAGVPHNHACALCACVAWTGTHQRCLQCGASLTASASACEVIDGLMYSLRQHRMIPVVSSVCEQNPGACYIQSPVPNHLRLVKPNDG